MKVRAANCTTDINKICYAVLREIRKRLYGCMNGKKKKLLHPMNVEAAVFVGQSV